MVLSLFNKFSPKYEQRLLSHCCNTSSSSATGTTNTTSNSSSRDIDGWNQDAVHYLVRKLKKNTNIIEELDNALRDKTPKSKCVLISKTPVKRLLISHRRALPQVIYCRLWRWSDLQSHHQIRAIPTCLSSVKSNHGVEQPLKSNLVCINPYHYDKTNPKPIQPVQVPYNRYPTDQISTSFEDSDNSSHGTRARVAAFPTFSTSFRPSTPITMPQQQQQINPLANQPLPGHIINSPTHHLHQQPSTIITVPPPPPLSSQPSQQQYHQQILQQQQQPQPQSQLPPPPTFQAQQHQYVKQDQHSYGQVAYQQSPDHIAQQQHPQMYQTAQDQYQLNQPQIYQAYQSQPPQPEHEQLQHQHQQQQQQQQHQQQQQQYSHHSPSHSSQSPRSQRMSTSGEVARPYRFKQPKFGHLARARREHSASNLPPRYDPQEYSPLPYSYMTHSPPQMPQDQMMRPVQQQQHPTQIQPPLITQQQPSPEQQQRSPPQPPMPGQFLKPEYARMIPPPLPPQSQHTPSYVVGSPQPPISSQLMMSPSYPHPQPQTTYQSQSEQAMHFDQQAADMNTYYNNPAFNSNVTMSHPDQTMIDIQEVPYIEGTSWCSISYHEYDQKIGEKFYSNCWRVVSVDGYTQPLCTDRFCIGGISNINRNQFTEWVRRRIGRGVRLTYVDGGVYAEGLSEASVYVSNPILAQEDGETIKEYVSKLTQGCSAKVFSTQDFQKLLADAVTKGFEAVYKLTRACVIRVSFVKGWGPNYKRNLIYHTPCWVEVQLNGPLQWIDKVLRQMRPPTGCGSTS